jgi:hypothetical protein
MVFLIVIEFFAKWLDESRFPREELKMRLCIALAGAFVLLTLAVLILINAID